MIGKTIAELHEGDHAELTRVVDPADIAAFVGAVGDYNPLHSDPDYAAGTMFRTPIAPGIFTAGMISAVIGTTLPGPGAIYLSQDLRFAKPVKAGDTITARVEVIELVRERNRIRLRTSCVNQRGEEVVSGEAWVMPSREPVVYARSPASAEALALWTLRPWTWATRGVAVWGLLGLRVMAAALPAPPPPRGQAPAGSGPLGSAT